MNRKAKMICTIGPAVSTPEAVAELVAAGMDVARLNFSHGTHETHKNLIDTIRQVSKRTGKPIAILQDLQGPKIRIGRFADGPVTVVPGGTFTITTEERLGDNRIVSTPYQNLPHDVKPGDHILLHDGLIRLKVEGVDSRSVTCQVIDGGTLADRTGITLPGVHISEPSLTEKDKKDLLFGLDQGVDCVALSFVRDAADIIGLRSLMGDRSVPIIAKLETAEAIEKLDPIVATADGVMVARGDLGAQISAARVPIVQKHIIEKCHNVGIPVITATQMLDSMMTQPTPTRAEASDVANAVFDGTDAVMLSGETAFGDYPIKSAETMAEIICEAEKSDYFRLGEPISMKEELTGAQAICRAAWYLADGVNAKAIVAFTTTGLTARLISKYRPKARLVAFTPFPNVLNQLALLWGVVPMQMDVEHEVEKAIGHMARRLAEEKIIESGDTVVVTAGSTVKAGGTNLLRIYTHV